jgi:hypothetical protein
LIVLFRIFRFPRKPPSLADGPAGSAVNSTTWSPAVCSSTTRALREGTAPEVGKGKTPVLTAEEAGELLRSIKTDDVPGLRVRA